MVSCDVILSWNKLLCPLLSSSLERYDLAAFSVAVVIVQSCLPSPTLVQRPAAALAYGEYEQDNFAKCNISVTMPAYFSCLAYLFILINVFVTSLLHVARAII